MRSKKKGITGQESLEFSTAEGQGLSGGEGVQLDWTFLNANLPTYGLWVP